jgi:predicted ester cyclase
METTHDPQEANKRAARQIYDVWDGGDEDVIDDIMAEDVVLNRPDAVGGPVRGRKAYKDNLRMVRAGFPDLFFRAHDVVAEDDKVIAYCTFGGTHEGELLGLEPTGASVDVWDFVMYRFDDGNVVEVTSLPDFLGLLLEVGAIEPPGAMST